MNSGEAWAQFRTRLILFSTWAFQILLDCVFLVVWALCQWVVERLGLFVSSRLHYSMLKIFEFTFALSTLAPVLIYVYTDIKMMIVQARMMIRAQEHQGVAINE